MNIHDMEGFEHTIVDSPSPSTLVGRDQNGNWVYDSDSEFLFSVGPLDSIADDSFYFSAMSHPMHFAIHRKDGHSYLVAGKSWDGVNHGIKKLEESEPERCPDCDAPMDGPPGEIYWVYADPDVEANVETHGPCPRPGHTGEEEKP